METGYLELGRESGQLAACLSALSGVERIQAYRGKLHHNYIRVEPGGGANAFDRFYGPFRSC